MEREIRVKSRIVSGLLLGTGLALSPGEAEASSTMVFEGKRYFCQTRCEVLVSSGPPRVVDAAGGWVRRPTLQPVPTLPPYPCDYWC